MALFKSRRNETKKDETSKVSALTLNPFGVSATMAAYKYGSYDNTFPSVCRIAEAFMTVVPYAKNTDGERIEPTPAAVEALYHPCKEMSSIDFFEALAVCALVHPCVQILIWHNENGQAVPGGLGATPDNICGFTFLENAQRIVTGGIISYQTAFGTFTDNDVLTVRLNANPYAVLDGYSPSIAAMKWSKIDDFVAEYQAGYFRNGAVPAGEFVITAQNADEFNEIVDKIKATTVGVEKNNKALYVHRPVSLAGESSPAQIEWVPFSQKNSELSMNQIFEQVNRKIDMTFGVPAEVNGFIQNSNYASVSTADYIFSRRVVYPKLVKIWSRFTHELNRITGGLGYIIGFDYDVPVLADETKIKAETAQKQLEVFLTAVNSGISPEDAVNALELPEKFAELKPIIELPQEEVTQPDLNPTNDNEEKQAREKATIKKDLGDTDDINLNLPARVNNRKLIKVIKDHENEIIANSIAVGKYQPPTKKDHDDYHKLFWLLLALSAVEAGEETYGTAVARLQRDGVSIPENIARGTYDFGTDKSAAVLERQAKLAETLANYDAETGRRIDEIFAEGRIAGWTQEEIVNELKGLINLDDYRIMRLATTEQYATDNLAWVRALSKINEAVDGIEIYKTWHIADAEACRDCTGLDGQRIPIDDTFVGAYERMPDGEINDFLPVEAPLLHPNCRCVLSWDFDWTTKSVSVKCPKCGRYLMDAKSCAIDKLICTNSSCKAHIKLTVADGVAKAEILPKEPKEPEAKEADNE